MSRFACLRVVATLLLAISFNPALRAQPAPDTQGKTPQTSGATTEKTRQPTPAPTADVPNQNQSWPIEKVLAVLAAVIVLIGVIYFTRGRYYEYKARKLAYDAQAGTNRTPEVIGAAFAACGEQVNAIYGELVRLQHVDNADTIGVGLDKVTQRLRKLQVRPLDVDWLQDQIQSYCFGQRVPTLKGDRKEVKIQALQFYGALAKWLDTEQGATSRSDTLRLLREEDRMPEVIFTNLMGPVLSRFPNDELLTECRTVLGRARIAAISEEPLIVAALRMLATIQIDCHPQTQDNLAQLLTHAIPTTTVQSEQLFYNWDNSMHHHIHNHQVAKQDTKVYFGASAKQLLLATLQKHIQDEEPNLTRDPRRKHEKYRLDQLLTDVKAL